MKVWTIPFNHPSPISIFSPANPQTRRPAHSVSVVGSYIRFKQPADRTVHVKGILVFREPPGFGMHTELWDGRRILQGDMDEKHLFSRPRILVWCCDPEMQST
jgi:hypothetical protein